MLKQIIEFIDKWRIEHQRKFADAKFFREFLFRDLEKEFGKGNELKEYLERNKRIEKQKLGRIKNQEGAKKYIESIKNDDDLCTIAEAMKILGITDRYKIDIPMKEGKIKKMGKRGILVMLDRKSVEQYANEIVKNNTGNIIMGPGVKMILPPNDPNKIMDDEDYDDDD